jgi:hypothetical protein
MSQKFRKYEIATTTWATLKKKIEKTTEEGSYYNTDLVAVVVELGKLCKEWGTDEEGNPTCIKQATKESIDIVWNAEPLADFTAYEIWCEPVGISSMGYTLDQEYTKEYCNKYPDYCKPAEIDEISDNL